MANPNASEEQQADTAVEGGSAHHPGGRSAPEELPSMAAALHQTIRLDGERELKRDTWALWWSALAAGISMTFSMAVTGVLMVATPDTEWGHLLSKFGYSVGFVVVVLARQQLITENTVTAVLPTMSEPSLKRFRCLLRLWCVVLVGNIIGTMLTTWVFKNLPIFDHHVHQAFLEMGHHLMTNTRYEMFVKGMCAGWIVATMVWLVPAAKQAKVFIIILMTSLIAIAGFTHIVVGASEAEYLVYSGQLTWGEFFLDFALPTLAGNIIGGTFIFALISHAQIRSDVA